MTADASLPPDTIPPTAVDGATGNDKAMKQFSRTDAERERAAQDATTPGESADAEPASENSTQPPPSTAPADPDIPADQEARKSDADKPAP
jgi:hypothetical protein